MSTTRFLDSSGHVVSIVVSNRRPWRDSGSGYRVVGGLPGALVVTDGYVQEYARYSYVREQLKLNEIRTGASLIDPERAKHILDGEPIVRSVETTLFDAPVVTTSVSGWSGGHANPDAAKYGKTQIPEFWTSDRFLFEVSDVLADPGTQWRRQEESGYFRSDSQDAPERYVCVEERYGVPIRVVADRVDNEFRCVTAFPDYGSPPSTTISSESSDVARGDAKDDDRRS